MTRGSRVDEVVEYVLANVESGVFPLGGQLPAEERLAELVGTSRLTVREGVKTLIAERVLSAVQGRGTFVNPIDQWRSADALMRMQHADSADVFLQLLEVRGFIEVGAAEAFAERASDAELAHLQTQVDAMIAGHASGDVERVMQADLAFHQIILDGCRNPFIAVTMQPLSKVLIGTRRETSSIPQMRAHAIDEHGKVLEALRARDRRAARRAMRSHMRQTVADARAFFGRSTGR